MPEREAEYLTRRAAQQLALAQRATLSAVTAAHYKIASTYLERAAPLLMGALTEAPLLESNGRG